MFENDLGGCELHWIASGLGETAFMIIIVFKIL
jgi:hypothetical protein